VSADELFRVVLSTEQDATNPAVAERLWRHFADPVFAAKKFDSVERARKDFDADAAGEAASLFARDRMLFAKGRDGALATLLFLPGHRARWELRLPVDSFESGALDWLHGLIGDLPVLFGAGAPKSEWDAKGGGPTEFRDRLPDVYWLTIFGEELVRRLGAAKLESLPGTEAVRLPHDQVAVRLVEPVVPDDVSLRLEIERQLAEELGLPA
jgi:hypothetical protein